MKRRHILRIIFAIPMLISAFVCLASGVFGNYGKIDNLHIYYSGNRITGVLEDADPVTTYGSMDYAGTTGKEMSIGYNEWGALTIDEARGISAVTYDNFGNPLRVSFSSPRGSYAKYVYSATGERLKAIHYTSPMIQEGVIEANPINNTNDFNNTGSVSADFVGMTKIEYHGPVIYRNGKIDMVRFPGGYATVNGTAVTFHYYTQDYLGSNRAVINGSTGAIEQTIAYYPYGSVIADLGTDTTGQPFKFGDKELVTDNGLNEYDFEARQYYPAIPHFTSIDPMCEKFYWLSPYLYCANNPVNAVDPDGKVLETLWDIGNIIYDTGAAIYNHVIGNHNQAASHWIDAGLDLGAALVPGFPAGVSKISKVADKAVDAADASKVVRNTTKGNIARQGEKKASTAVHGNSKSSEKAQHLYEIYDKETGEVIKTGISGRNKTKSGKSYRANRQVNKWDKEAGKKKFDSEIVQEFPAGPSAREKALNEETKNAKRLKKKKQLKDTNYHKRPEI